MMNIDKISEYESLIDSGSNAEDVLKSLANNGDSDALYVLGIAYYDGDLPPRRTEEAIGFLERASSLGHTKARHDLACFHYYGYNLPASFIDLKKSAELFELNAKDRYVPSLVFLSKMYKNGEGVVANLKKSQQYLEQAIQNGHNPNST